MNTQTTTLTAGEIVTVVLGQTANAAEHAAQRNIIFHTELQDPHDAALLNAIYDLLDDNGTDGRRERVEAAHTLLEEFSDGARKYSAKYDELAADVRRAAAVLPRSSDEVDAFNRIMRRGYAGASKPAGRLVDTLA